MKTGLLETYGRTQEFKSLLFTDSSGNRNSFVGLVGPGTPFSSQGVIWELPYQDGLPGETLTTNGAGVLYWTTAPSADVYRGEINGLEQPDPINRPGTWTVPHALGEKYVQIQVYNQNSRRVVEDDTKLIDNATLELTLDSFLIDGILPQGESPWYVVVVG